MPIYIPSRSPRTGFLHELAMPRDGYGTPERRAVERQDRAPEPPRPERATRRQRLAALRRYHDWATRGTLKWLEATQAGRLAVQSYVLDVDTELIR